MPEETIKETIEEDPEAEGKTEEELGAESKLEETEEEATEEGKPAKKKSVQERIDELTYKFREAEREAQHWKELAPKEEPPKPSKEGRPDQENYETATEYEDALFEWYENKRNTASLKAFQEKKLQEDISNFKKNAAKLREEHKDFDEVMEHPVFTDPMRNALFSSEHGPMVAYHIATNRDTSDKIKSLSPEQQVYEIGKLEAQLLLAQKTKKVTTASEPITPVGITGSPKIDPSKLNIDDWMKWDREQEIERLKTKIGG